MKCNPEPLLHPLIVFHVDFNITNPQPDRVRLWLKHAAEMGYNAVLWEVEDKIQWTSCPECVHPEAMSKAQFRELLDYSRTLGLEPIPLLQTVGHAEYVLLHTPYQAWRESPEQHDCYCTTNPAVKLFLKKWLQEYLELFGSLRYFHLGGDEAYVFGTCPSCRARIAETSAGQLYAEHLGEIASPLAAAGIRPCVWGDMLLNHPDEIQALPQEFVIWDWNYRDGLPSSTPGERSPFPSVDILKKMGRDIVLCSAARAYGDGFFFPALTRRVDNVAGAAIRAKVEGLLGTCVTSWGIRLNRFETHAILFPLAPAVMRSDRSVEEVINAVIPEQWRAHWPQLTTLILEFNKLSAFRKLKDSLPAPAGHIAGVIAWLKDNKPELWAERDQVLTQAVAALSAGIQELENDPAPPSAAKAWSMAACFQLRTYQAMKLLLGKEPDRATAHAELMVLKNDFSAYLGQDLTPLNARHCAGLVFDPLIEFAE